MAPQVLGNVLVVGGCGFLGHYIVEQLYDRPGTKVSVFDVAVDRNRYPRVSYNKGDICSRSDVTAALECERPDVIIHTASPPAVDNLELQVYTKVNVAGTQNLLDCAIQCRSVKAFIYTSSASVVHDAVSDMSMADETYPVLRMPQQRAPYSHTKGIADDMVLAANRSTTLARGKEALLTCCLRPSSIFGPRDYTAVKTIIGSAKAGRYRVQVGSGTNLFDFTYVGNVARAHILAAEKLLQVKGDEPAGTRVEGQAFFITNGEPTRFWEFVRSLGAAGGYPVDTASIRVVPGWLALAMSILAEWFVWLISLGQRKSVVNSLAVRYSFTTRTYNIDKARKRLGYAPTVSVAEAIKMSGDWFKEDERQARGKMDYIDY
jgi:sterol-4alpha-carboxylate 3-dehydrogenase (decarboxylating)